MHTINMYIWWHTYIHSTYVTLCASLCILLLSSPDDWELYPVLVEGKRHLSVLPVTGIWGKGRRFMLVFRWTCIGQCDYQMKIREGLNQFAYQRCSHYLINQWSIHGNGKPLNKQILAWRWFHIDPKKGHHSTKSFHWCQHIYVCPGKQVAVNFHQLYPQNQPQLPKKMVH